MAKSKALELSIHIAGRVDKSLMASINTTQNQLSNLARNMSQVGTAGIAAMGALATGTVMAISSCTKEAEKFANGMGDVVKYVDGLADKTGKIDTTKYAEMSRAIRDLSTQIPYTQDELQKLAASAGQSGKKMDDLFRYDRHGNISGFLKDVAIMGTAWDIEAEKAGDWAAKWEVALNMTHDEVMTLANQINYLGANNATTAAEIGEVVNKVASFGQVAGMLPDDTAALATALLAMGVHVDVASSSINRMYTNLNKGSSATKAQKEMWKSMGMTAEGVALGMQENATETLKSVFTAIRNLPKENQVAALSTLLGQWAIQAGGKLTTNLEAFVKALDQANDPANYDGSMMREFTIKADTPEAVDTMLKSSISAFAGEIGDSFLPAKKAMSLAVIDFIRTLRNDMPQIQQIAETWGTLFSQGVTIAGEAMHTSLPYIQQGLDYLMNNGPQVVSVLKGMAAAFVAMKFSPALERLLGGAGSLLFGTTGTRGGSQSGGLLGAVKGLWDSGHTTAAGIDAALRQGITTGQQAAGITDAGRWAKARAGVTGTLASLWNFGGITSKNIGKRDAAWNNISATVRAAIDPKSAVASSGIGRYFGGIKGSWDNLLNTGIGGGIAKGVVGTGGVAKEILSGISQATGLTDLVNGTLGLAKGSTNWVAGKAGGAMSAIMGSPQAKAIGGAAGAVGNFAGPVLGEIGSFASAGAGLLGSVWGPMAAGFGSLFTGVVPIIGAISAVIAIVSILGDHLEDIRGIVGNVFGDSGLAVFDSFTGKLQEVGGFISGLFGDGGVANALAPLRENILQMFGPEAGAAFDGLTGILQSVMGVVGQIVSFSTGTVKPIIQDSFSFITETVMPILLQTFTDAAPYIATIIDGLGTGIMAGMQTIGMVIQAVMPIVQGLITVFLKVGSVVIPALLAGVSVFATGIGNIMGFIQGIFNGLITFITGVFSGNWRQAWQGVKDIFGNAFNALVELCKTPINAVIAIINGVFDKLRGLSFTIPDWSPIGAGAEIGFNWLPTLTPLAKGGFTNGPSLAGEAGREAVISFQRGVRGQNIATWMQAGRMLGISEIEASKAAGVQLKEIDAPITRGGPGGGQIVFAPQINIQGNADRTVIDQALAEAEARFRTWYEEMERQKERKKY